MKLLLGLLSFQRVVGMAMFKPRMPPPYLTKSLKKMSTHYLTDAVFQILNQESYRTIVRFPRELLSCPSLITEQDLETAGNPVVAT
jgi:hypothetical protein